MSARDALARDALARIGDEVDALFGALAPLADEFAGIASASGQLPGPGLRPLTREGLADLRGTIADILATHRGFAAGCGVIPAAGLLEDAQYWMEWWWTSAGREPEPLRVNLEPLAPDFFDYTTADWFVTPEHTLARHIAGPYVDYVCTNEYATTLALPVVVDDAFVGIAALDVTVAAWEERFVPLLRTVPGTATLTNTGGRVIASSSPAVVPGQRLDLADRDAVLGSTAFGWHLVGAGS